MQNFIFLKAGDWVSFLISMEKNIKVTRKVAEGTRGPFFTTGRSSLPAADTLRRRRKQTNKKHKT